MSSSLHHSIIRAASELWNYHRLHELLLPADGILVFGSNDLRVADHAAELYHRGMASWILFTGGRGRMTEHWPDTEAACFAARAKTHGVPDEVVYCEPNATHTGENILFSREMMARHSLDSKHVIVLQKPYMERRTRASIEKHWPELSFRVSSPPIPMDQYPNDSIGMDDLIHAMVGDLFRIIDYADKGLSTAQIIPSRVHDAYHHLMDAGYTRYVPR
jgi:uncharacterized SAM-binding protein YcdF (DUF218 family)